MRSRRPSVISPRCDSHHSANGPRGLAAASWQTTGNSENLFQSNRKATLYLILEGKVDKTSTLYVNLFSDLSKYNHTTFDPNDDQNTELVNSNHLKTAKRFKLVDIDFLKALDHRNYKKLEAYIETNGIDIKSIEGLTQVIDYWSEIQHKNPTDLENLSGLAQTSLP